MVTYSFPDGSRDPHAWKANNDGGLKVWTFTRQTRVLELSHAIMNVHDGSLSMARAKGCHKIDGLIEDLGVVDSGRGVIRAENLVVRSIVVAWEPGFGGMAEHADNIPESREHDSASRAMKLPGSSGAHHGAEAVGQGPDTGSLPLADMIPQPNSEKPISSHANEQEEHGVRDRINEQEDDAARRPSQADTSLEQAHVRSNPLPLDQEQGSLVLEATELDDHDLLWDDDIFEPVTRKTAYLAGPGIDGMTDTDNVLYGEILTVDMAGPDDTDSRGRNPISSTAVEPSETIRLHRGEPEHRTSLESSIPGKRRSSSSRRPDANSFDADRVVKRTAHNMVEKRYRVNINAKIAALRDSLSRFRTINRSTSNATSADAGPEGSDTTASRARCGKGEVLTGAVEYIRHLESRVQKLAEENSSLRARVTTLERNALRAATNPNEAVEAGSTLHISASAVTVSTNAADPSVHPQGMIQVPENIRRLRVYQSQPHDLDQFLISNALGPTGKTDEPNRNGKTRSGSFVRRSMVGSLAGLF